MKIRKCCQNCKHYECWDEEDGDYGCELVYEKEDIADYWNSYDKNECKHYEIDLNKLAEVYVIDKEQDRCYG